MRRSHIMKRVRNYRKQQGRGLIIGLGLMGTPMAAKSLKRPFADGMGRTASKLQPVLALGAEALIRHVWRRHPMSFCFA